jgi:hypothetical protein
MFQPTPSWDVRISRVNVEWPARCFSSGIGPISYCIGPISYGIGPISYRIGPIGLRIAIQPEWTNNRAGKQVADPY